MRLRHKSWAEELLANNRNLALNKEDIEQGNLPQFTALEIGSGCGEFLIGKALTHPEINFLGVEINRTAFAIAIKKLLALEKVPNNIHFLNADIALLLPTIKDESLDAIYLNFNDPWPKKKHNKRRLTYPTKLNEYYRILKTGGTLFYKSDNDVYYEGSKEYFTEFQKFDVEFIDNYEQTDVDDVQSEYEQKFRTIGKSIHRIIATKGDKHE